MFKEKFSRRIENIEVSAIKQMPLIARSVPDAISLGQGIPSVPTPKYIREKVIEYLNNDEAIGKYSLQPGVPELKQAVAGVIAARAGRAVDPESEIFISAGAMEALFAAIVSIVDEGDEVLLFDPSYSSHIEQVIFAGGKPVFVPLNREDWSVDEEALRSAVTPRTKAIVVCNPANPTGKVFTAEELECIVTLAKDNGLFVISDETYDFLVYDDTPFVSLTTFSAIKQQLIACFSFSKEYAMTGWRVGYMYASSTVIAQALKVHDAAVICAPTISQFAALAALTSENTDGEADLKEVLRSRRDVLCAHLDGLPDLFDYVKPSGAYYVLARYLKTDLDSESFALKVLHEARVITIPGRAFGPNGEGYIRFSYGGTEEEINNAFDRIRQWNSKL